MSGNDLTVKSMVVEGIQLGVRNAAPILLAVILWFLTCWIPYLNVGTTIALFIGVVAKLSRDEKISAPDIFNAEYRKYMGEFFLTLIFLIVGSGIGILFGFIPGIVIAIAWSQALLLVIDRGMNPMEALSMSNKLTYGHKVTLFFGNLIINIAYFVVLFILSLFLGFVARVFQSYAVFKITMFLGSILNLACFVLMLATLIGVQAYVYRVLTGSFQSDQLN